MRRPVLAFLGLAVAVGTGVVPARGAADLGLCRPWVPGAETLNAAVRSARCVTIPPGTWTVLAQVNVPTDHRIVGAGRDASVLTAAKGFTGGSMFATNGAQRVVISDLTVDLAGFATGGLGATGMTIGNVRVTGARCWGIGVNGPNMVVRRSLIDHNGATCPFAPPGTGIYIVSAKAGGAVIEDSVIRDNAGPGVDVNRAPSGRFLRNTVTGNGAWAGLSLYGSAHWLVADNVIDHRASPRPRRYHPYCDPGYHSRAPKGRLGAAIFLCHDDGYQYAAFNRVIGNFLSGGYGILVIGADDPHPDPRRTRPWWVPRNNTFAQNITWRATVGCADDLRPGQWRAASNTWVRNDCQRGRADTPPLYF